MFISKKHYNALIKERDKWQRLAEATQELNNKAIETLTVLAAENEQLKAPQKCPWCDQIHS